MTSILTNAGAVSALQTLRALNSSMMDAQGRVSSGLRVQTAGDNAAYWAVATTMRSDNMALDAVSDALGISESIVENEIYQGVRAVQRAWRDGEALSAARLAAFEGGERPR